MTALSKCLPEKLPKVSHSMPSFSGFSNPLLLALALPVIMLDLFVFYFLLGINLMRLWCCHFYSKAVSFFSLEDIFVCVCFICFLLKLVAIHVLILVL